MAITYNSYFFNEFYAKNGGGNYTNREQWEPFFTKIAEEIIDRFNPKTVLDAGCAMGYLVEAFRSRGVEAYGIDISEYAIGNVKEDIKPYCAVHSILDPLPANFPQKYDLIITLEVLEHLFPEEGKQALDNLCKYTDKVIFSSTPDDIDDRTHVNVQLGEYWARLFAENSFYHDLVQPLNFICPWAMLFVKKEEQDISNIVFNYELNMRINQEQRDSEKDTLLGKLYYDQGYGFSEESCINLPDMVNFKEFNQRITLPENTLAVRFDPVENKACVLRDLQIISNNGTLGIDSLNGILLEEFIIFDNFDPWVFIDLSKEKINWIEIKVEIFAFSDINSVSMLSRFREIQQLRERLEKNKEELQEHIRYKENELRELQSLLVQNNEEYNQKSLTLKSTIEEQNKEIEKLISQMEQLIQQKKEQEKTIEEQNKEIDELVLQIEEKDFGIVKAHTQITELESELHHLRALFDSIINSTFWKLSKPIRSLLGLMKKKNQLKKTSEAVFHNIDTFNFKENVLTVNGWLFSEQGDVDGLRLKIIIEKNEYRIDLVLGLQRKDVEEIYFTENARYSGFQSTTLIENCNKFKVYLEFILNGEKMDLYVGEFRSPFLSRIKYISQRITKQNVRKLISYLRHKRVDLIKSAIKRPRVSAVTSALVPSLNLPGWLKDNLTEKLSYPEEIYNYTVDIVVPVYNGYEYFDKLFYSIPLTRMKYRLIIINDKSLDSRVLPYLQELAANDSRVVLLQNETNVGFVQSVNNGLRQASNHVALLNTDIELPEFWLERLMLPILLGKRIASSTPFTNAGTLCSFPNIGVDNPIFGNMSCNEVDKAFQLIKPSYTELPTGVGFCMGMNKNVIKEIGLFDAETFSKGYGEENDWCQRAIKSGYKNVSVENLFVYHKHGGSFLSEEKKRLIERNGKLLSAKYPDYNADVANFFERDPLKNIRDFIIMKLTSNLNEKSPILAIDHNIGGGANAYLDNLRKEKVGNGEKMMVIRYEVHKQFYLFYYYYGEYEISYRFMDFADIEKIIGLVGCQEIYINELVTYPKLYETFEDIINLRKITSAKLILLLHDYFSICPMTNLINDKQVYCNLPDINQCENCAKNNPLNNYWHYESIKKWRSEWKTVINTCDEIIAFSGSSAEILQEVYGELDNLKVVPHQVNYIPELPRQRSKSSEVLNIGLLGILNFHKGLDVIREMLTLIKDRELNVRITLLGSSEGAIQDPNFFETGKYTPESLPRLVLENDIDLFFISSIWPETFSYTTEEAMKMGLPVAVFNLGAPAERVKEYEKGLVISEINAEVALKEITAFSKGLFTDTTSFSSHKQKVLFIAEYISFSSRYRVEHFIEQLLIQGVSSDFIEVKDLDKCDFQKFHSIVIYRCTYTGKLGEFIEKAHKFGKVVFYDIDDYIFNYEDIKNLPFLSGEDYLDFENYSSKIFKCMALCDGFFTSTNNMERAIKKLFPNKPVCVNRNVASMEMVSLSNKAKSNPINSGKSVTLGYFSGSKTHDGDFAIINDVLLKIMDNYDNVDLKIGGCLQLSDEFKKYNSRIVYFDFVDWRKLPELIASVDINLMPLEDSFFHACKSENKWMEAALVNVPTVASLNSELELIIENGVTGYLCKDQADWEKALTELVESKNLRQKIGQAANAKVLKDHVTINTGEKAKKIVLQENISLDSMH
ncbi:glycosyltransferase [Paenibacillus faecis]|uniref:Glycosyltransferase n=1 Tax=Paenibacillus faecis TaxID=862114 RepID=A0A5D0CRX3_9BACL|nr:glycosyltransferase [Paenibacillus faecis]TYA11815.1 glycosyltransferase [Paenibacillus faecis]